MPTESEVRSTEFSETFVCVQCRKAKETCQESEGKLRDEQETANGLCYLDDTVRASGKCETAVTARIRLGGIKFRV